METEDRYLTLAYETAAQLADGSVEVDPEFAGRLGEYVTTFTARPGPDLEHHRDTTSALLTYAIARAPDHKDTLLWRFQLGQLQAARIGSDDPPEAWEQPLADMTAALDHVIATGRAPEDMGTAEQATEMMSRAVLWAQFLYVRAEIDKAHGHPSVTEDRFREFAQYSHRFATVFTDSDGAAHLAVLQGVAWARVHRATGDPAAARAATVLLERGLPTLPHSTLRTYATTCLDDLHEPVPTSISSEDLTDLFATVRLIRFTAESYSAEEVVKRLQMTAWYLMRIAEITGDVSDWDTVITSCTDLLALPGVDPESAAVTHTIRLTAVRTRYGDDVRRALEEVPLKTWARESRTLLDVVVTHPDADADIVAGLAYEQAETESQLMNSHRLGSMATLTGQAERILTLLELAGRTSDPDLQVNVADLRHSTELSLAQASGALPDHLVGRMTDVEDPIAAANARWQVAGFSIGHAMNFGDYEAQIAAQSVLDSLVNDAPTAELAAIGQIVDIQNQLTMGRIDPAMARRRWRVLIERVEGWTLIGRLILPSMVVSLRQLAREEGIDEILEFPAEDADPLHPVPRLADQFLAAAHSERLDEMNLVRARLRAAHAAIDPKDDILRRQSAMYMAIADRMMQEVVPDDPDALDAAIASLEESLLDTQKNRLLHPATSDLAALRRKRDLPGDRNRSRTLAFATLGGLTWHVLVQSNATDAIAFARTAAADAEDFVTWCWQDGADTDLVGVLEAQRGLVLHAVATRRDLSTRLEEAGEHEVARQWVDSRGNDPVLLPDDSAEVPTRQGLGRRALDLVGDALLPPPTIAEIQSVLQTRDTAALVYLVPATDERPGLAVCVPASGDVEVEELPDLVGDRVVAYAGTAVERMWAKRDDPELRRRWSDELDELCSWAWPAAGRHLRYLATRHGTGTAPRIVLIAAGVLGMVPWHAARDPRDRYLVEDVTVSYSPSARLLCSTTGRRLVEAGQTVLVGNPAANLPHGGIEAQALYDGMYPDAKHFGGFGGTPAREWRPMPDGAGTPAQVVSALREEVDVVHFACHGLADITNPQESYLELAGGAHLTTRDLIDLDPATGIRANLVTLAACTTNTIGVDFDEALTLSTMFLASGARSAIGSLWPVSSQHTARMMIVFYHHLRTQEPVEALRSAQLWMLDEDAAVPTYLPKSLTGVRTSDRSPAYWAPFAHPGR